MAVVRLSDAVIPLVYESYMSLNYPELTAVWNSGLIATSDTFNTIAKQGGKTGVLPFWQDLDPNIEPNMSNDDPDDKATPQKVGSGQMNYRKAWVNQGWSTMDLVQELASSDPMRHIASRTNTYWARQLQRRLVATLKGLVASNIANNASDMVVDISAETGDAAIINGDVVIDASGTMGDYSGNLTGILVHSKIRDRFLKDDLIVYMPDSEGRLTIPTYMGLRVVVDDSLVYSGTGANTVYLSVLFANGAIGWGGALGSNFAFGEGAPRVPVAIHRDEDSGNGGGQETLWERNTWIIHPLGFNWVEGTLTEFSPTLSDLAQAAHWTRVVYRKQAPMAFVLSKA